MRAKRRARATGPVGGDATPDTVLLVSHGLQRTGAPLVLLTYGRWLREQGVAVETLALTGGELLPEFSSLGPVHRLPAWRTATQRLLFGRLHLADRRVGPALMEVEGAACRTWVRAKFSHVDLVHANTVHSGWLAPHFASTATSFVSHIHELPFWIEHQTPPREVESMLRSANLIVCVSQACSHYFRHTRGVPARRLLVIPPMLPSLAARRDGRSAFRAQLRIDDGAFVIGGCGTLDWRKGPELFLQVALQMSAQATNRDWIFLWLGGTHDSVEMARLNYDVRKMGLEGSVSFIGGLTDPVGVGWYAALDAFVVTSREDPFPLVMLEAADAGLPIVGFAGSGGIDEFVRSGETGQLVPYGDSAAMARVLVSWSGDHPLRASLGQTAHQTRLKALDADELCARLYKHERVLSADKTRRRR